MKKTQSNKVAPIATADEPRAEYRFDYGKARPNRFAGRAATTGLVVALDPDVAKVFATKESVNAVLRALIANMPSSPKTKKSHA
jgi:hypothetical protein